MAPVSHMNREKSVEYMLQTLQLMAYTDEFREAQVFDVETVLTLRESDYDEIGIDAESRARIQRWATSNASVAPKSWAAVTTQEWPTTSSPSEALEIPPGRRDDDDIPELLDAAGDALCGSFVDWPFPLRLGGGRPTVPRRDDPSPGLGRPRVSRSSRRSLASLGLERESRHLEA